MRHFRVHVLPEPQPFLVDTNFDQKLVHSGQVVTKSLVCNQFLKNVKYLHKSQTR